MPQTQRLIITAPVVAILVGLGLVACARTFVAWTHVAARTVACGAALALLACMAASLYAYFGGWAATAHYGGRNGHATTELAYYLRALGPNGVGYVLGGRVGCRTHDTIAFLAPGRCLDLAPADVPTIVPFSTGGPVAFVALPDAATS